MDPDVGRALLVQVEILSKQVADLQAAMQGRGLTSEDGPNTVNTPMQAGPSSNALRSSAQLDANSGHKFVAMLKKRKITVAIVSAYLTQKLRRPVPRNTVQAWYKKADDPGARRIPQDAAEVIRDAYGLPLSAWPNIRPPE